MTADLNALETTLVKLADDMERFATDDWDEHENVMAGVVAITTLRAQLAEARADLTFMTENRNKWQDSATQRWFRLEEANARADRAEAERAAQIEVDADIALTYPVPIGCTKAAIEIASQITHQPHDRTALDRMLADARVKSTP